MPMRKDFILSGEIIVVAIIILLVILFVTDNFINFLNFLYNPFAIIVAVIMALEFVIIRIFDKSRLYRLQIRMFRKKRKETLATQRDLLNRLNGIEEKLNSLEKNPSVNYFQNEINWMKERLKR